MDRIAIAATPSVAVGQTPMLRLVSWNISRRDEAWRALVEMEDIDAALLQEAGLPPDDVKEKVVLDLEPPWSTGGAGLNRPWRAAVVGLSNRVVMEPLAAKAIDDAEPRELAVSRMGTLSVARLTVPGVPRPSLSCRCMVRGKGPPQKPKAIGFTRMHPSTV